MSSNPFNISYEEWMAALAAQFLLFELNGDLTGQKDLMEAQLPWIMKNEEVLQNIVRKVKDKCLV